MKKLVFTLLALAVLFEGKSHGQPASYSILPKTIGEDKLLHFSISMVSTGALIRMGEARHPKKIITWKNRLIHTGVILLIGYAKERVDMLGGNSFDYPDMEANLWGSFTGNLIVYRF